MKKAKKLLSVFLAALMVMTTLGGVMTASAATNEAATAAAAAFNEKAAATDHSAVYENMSAKSSKTNEGCTQRAPRSDSEGRQGAGKALHGCNGNRDLQAPEPGCHGNQRRHCCEQHFR